MRNIRKVVVALSGGSSSAVSAFLLKKKGFDVTGVFMRYWSKNDELFKSVDEESSKAEWVCNKLHIPFLEVDFTQEFWKLAYENLIADYNIGSVPHPDIVCNEYIQFGCFYKYCLEKLDTDAIATGHFVRSSYGAYLEKYVKENARLLISIDKNHDQTYILSRICQDALQRCMFPVGELTKDQVDSIYRENYLDVIHKSPENEDYCFLRSSDYKRFVSKVRIVPDIVKFKSENIYLSYQYVLGSPGMVIDVTTGKVVGEHKGLHNYLKGDRFNDEYYVVDNDEKNCIFVVSSKDHPAFYCHLITISSGHWISDSPLEFVHNRLYHTTFKLRQKFPLSDCILINLFDYPEYGFGLLESKIPMYGVTPGQYAALYNGEECVGSFKIESTGPPEMFNNIKPKLQ